jgi:hypothetical protein
MMSLYPVIGVDPELVPRPERTPEIARRIQHHQVSLQQRPWAAGITALSPEQQEWLAAVGLAPPTVAAL